MENFFMEAVAYLQPPSKDVQLVIFTDDSVRENKSEVYKHLQQCVTYAQQHHLYLVTGMFIHETNLCLCLIGPNGELLCRQGANQIPGRFRGRLRPALTQHVVATSIGNLSLCVDVDIYYPQVLRTAAMKGADLVISIQHLAAENDTYSRLMATVWNAAQTNNFYVMNYSGGSCTVACPAALNRNRDGYIIRRTSIVPMHCGFNLRKLGEIRERFPLLQSLNKSLIETHSEALGRW